jgi:hypothetical protein
MSGGSNGCDAAVAAAIEGESARQEKVFAQVTRALALANDPEWRRKHAHLIDAVRRLPRADS